MTADGDAGVQDPQTLDSKIEFYRQYEHDGEEVGWFEWVGNGIGLVRGDSVLDVGCGNGVLWATGEWSCLDQIDLTVADRSAAMVRRTRSRVSSLSVRSMIANCQSLPLATDAFDRVVANHFLHLVDDLEWCLDELGRVIAPDGTLYVTTKDDSGLETLDRLLSAAGIDETVGGCVQFGVDDAHRRLSRRFEATVSVDLYEQEFRLFERDLDALVEFVELDVSLTGAQRSVLREATQRAVRNGGSITFEKSPGLLTVEFDR